MFSKVAEVLTRTAASAGEIIADRELRKKATNLVATRAGAGIKTLQEGVQSGAQNIQHGLNTGITTVQSGPRQIQSMLARLQQRIEEQRLQAQLQAERDAPVDVQMGPVLYEDAPQELRSRLWLALLENPSLTGNLHEQRDLEELLSPKHSGSQTAGSLSSILDERRQSNASASSQDAAAARRVGSQRSGGLDDEQGLAPSRAAGRAGGGGDQPDAAWEMVEGTSQLFDWRGKMGLEAQLQPCFPSQFGPEAETLRHRLMLAAMAMPWPISPEYAEDCKYNVLLQISIGQEEVDEVISRDINRTFPEHPQFGFQQGQQALFRVLKAYSLHDLEVGYCQGMAFVAGIILMYVPEEPSFRTLARLMDSQGPNLRRLYLPGLEGLKQQLRMLEWLMERLYPDLKAHLEAFGAVPVLYASQWFLTVFSCPFPASFSCRVIDVMLIENRAHILLRAALAVLAECDADLMALHDFEDLITYVKIEPVRWAHHRSRKVLNLAVTDFVSDDMIAAAQHAIENGYEGSMSRRSSSITEAAAAAAIAAVESASGPPTRNTSMGRLAGAAAGDPSAEASPLLADVSAKLAAMQAAGVSPNLMPAHPRHPSAGGKAGASGERDGAVEAELASQKADMDADYMAMVLALDVLWAGDNSGVQQQTAQQAQQQQQQQGEDQHAQHS
ncbi:hypothetical protein WJX72_008962 [[Myrmecia] bisecta]|uniref:Rab-GAP TBC domain-containing protein n=1 Tax=[Myrmecia] bisecta TaxID=41462 RepID=A0AAW1Q7Q2_9CHLO